jgi:two-component system, OmpR family, response regulator
LACSVSPSTAPVALVCDGDAYSARAVGRALAGAGFVVRTAHTGVDCLAAARETPPALIVLSILLPDLDGLVVTARLRADGVGCPIVVTSVLEAETRALAAGADRFLRKPIRFARLAALARELTGAADAEACA